MPDDRPFNRRNFFRHGFKELLRPLQNAAGPLEEMIKQLSSLDLEEAAVVDHQAKKQLSLQGSAGKITGIPVRPPGALAEQKFRETCSRCGECVKVCPVQCIKIDPSGVKGAGAPFIDIDTAACAMCDGLICMNTCPSGALIPIPIGDIDMGHAVWQEDSCLRTSGQDCTTCIDVCPIGEMAIVADGKRITVLQDGCTGCGMCQNRCPTQPKSIFIRPKSAIMNPSQPRGRTD